METTDLARVRAETLAKRPAHVTRAVPLTLTAVRARPAVRQPSRLERFNDWRRAHYVADQLMRVAAIAAGGLTVLATLFAVGWWAAVSLFAGGGLATVGGVLLAVAAVVALLVSVGAALGRKDHGGHSGYGFHWTKCK